MVTLTDLQLTSVTVLPKIRKWMFSLKIWFFFLLRKNCYFSANINVTGKEKVTEKRV